MEWIRVIAPAFAGALGTFLFVWLVNRRRNNEASRVELKTGPIVFWFSLVAGFLIFSLGVLLGFSIFWMDGDLSGDPVLLFGLTLMVCVIGYSGIWFALDSRTRWARWDKVNIIIH